MDGVKYSQESNRTVDGRNPAPPGMYTGAGFQPSTVFPD